MRSALLLVDRRSLALAALLAAVFALSGCFMAYFPMLLLVPFMPIIKLAVTIAAKYGPLLLLLVEADPAVNPDVPETMIAYRPQHPMHCELVDLETQLVHEVRHNPALRRIAVLEADRLCPEWLAAEAHACAARGERITLVFVDSRRFADGATLGPHAHALVRERALPVEAGEGLAHAAIGRPARPIAYDVPEWSHDPPAPASPLMAAVAACDGPIAPPR